MSRMVSVVLMMISFAALAGPAGGQVSDAAWLRLFDGKTLDGWKASENTGTFTVQDGAIVARGARSHLFYTGPVEDAQFQDFELKVEVMTEPGSNGGIYFHTRYQETDWPRRGCEVQVNNSFAADPRKTGSLYGMQDVRTDSAKDKVWFTEHIIVQGNHVTVFVDDKKVVDWTAEGRQLRGGTFALQGHDPGSTVRYRNIYVKPLPVLDFPIVDYHVHLKGGLTLDEAVAMSQQRGVKFGIAENCGVGFPTTNDAALEPFLKRLEGAPAYRAMQAEGREWVTMFSPETIAKFDYVFTDSMTWTNDAGKRMRLWIPSEVEIDDKQAFMDMLVERTVGILTNEPIDIYANPTFLPAEIADEYDTLWTDERMAKVIDAAVKNGVAIEINARYRLPSERFVRKAKAAGAKFSFGTNNGGRDDLGDLAYSLMIARRCGLTASDMFVPKPDGRKPIQRKGLPK
ncbi:MAG: DUF1080 domain-containing protein [Sedimentisphaerales bacterium]|nr:DUF1080 domain-containing protein [Sedimentisphaerales bacterium]HNY77755.1 DUF1080 domain-containing protein [Sedimentisphaerales bacterium]HOC63499.1 DUF1080 domain-containing protein [Sedimentisphaerales bacterium]HOH63930.1 DUF1080 domain-containing protein [Sedimentisphaerales bacterium]HQA88751.1 DUF1080 domain-containing protein [Sedimentisphaerales bacterium]